MMRLKALYDYQAGAEGELSFATGDILTLVEERGEWIMASFRGRNGLVPGNYVERMAGPPPMMNRPPVNRPPMNRAPSGGPSRGGLPMGRGGGPGMGAARNSPMQPMGMGGPPAQVRRQQPAATNAAAPYMAVNTTRAAAKPKARARRPKHTQRFALFAHNLALFAGWSLLCLAPTTLVWYSDSLYLRLAPDARLTQSKPLARNVAYYSLGVGAAVTGYESSSYGMRRLEALGRFPARGLLYLSLSGFAFLTWPTLFGALALAVSGVFNIVASVKGESGDASHLGKSLFGADHGGGGGGEDDDEGRPTDSRLVRWLKKKRESETLGETIFTLLYFLTNVALAVERYIEMNTAVTADRQPAVVHNLPSYQLSYALVWAKVFGQLLNFNCALLLLPVCRVVLRALNATDAVGKLVPLRKNIIFHKAVACVILLCTVGHVVAHFINYAESPVHTGQHGDPSKPPAAYSPSLGIWWVTGGMIMVAMLSIYSGARDFVKRAYYEVFWISHHFFILFYAPLFHHGKKFYIWASLPVALYVLERVLRVMRGRTPFYLRYVEWRPPVMQLQFCPQLKQWFKFKEGQYLYLNAPYLSSQEWHPFTISSAYEDLIMDDFTSLHIRIQPGGWTERLKDYLAAMAGKSGKEPFTAELHRRNEKAEMVVGKFKGPDDKPLIRVDGPHPAPAQHYDEYKTVMLVGAGIGLTPSAAIIRAVLRHKWKKGFQPDIIHFYWVVRHSEVKSFLWFVELLTALEKGVAGDRQAGSLNGKYVELNVYVTGAPSEPTNVYDDPALADLGNMSLNRPGLLPSGFNVDIGFDTRDLLNAILNPRTSSKQQQVVMGDPEGAPNRLQDIWIWNGRPNWDQIFQGVRDPPCPHKDIAVCFCGTPIIGKDLSKMCVKYSSVDSQVQFHLHKENF